MSLMTKALFLCDVHILQSTSFHSVIHFSLLLSSPPFFLISSLFPDISSVSFSSKLALYAALARVTTTNDKIFTTLDISFFSGRLYGRPGTFPWRSNTDLVCQRFSDSSLDPLACCAILLWQWVQFTSVCESVCVCVAATLSGRGLHPQAVFSQKEN